MKILDYSWHQAHLYRLTQALPATFTVCALRQPPWNLAQRPIPPNVEFVAPDDIDPRDYDLAILHLDQWCDDLNLRAFPYRFMNQKVKSIPRVVIMHGTPDSKGNRERVLRLIGDLPVVCNSKQAAREWDGGEERLDKYGLPQFRAIIHGYCDDWLNYPLALRTEGAITICSGGDLSREYHGLPVVERLKRDVKLTWYGPRGDKPWANNFLEYRRLLARASIYFSPTRRAPMPGARTEAMLSGCCIVSVPGNDIEDYIDSGTNGYIVSTYSEARDVLNWLLDNPAFAFEVGQAGRKTALLAFDPWRYGQDWLRLLVSIGVL